MSRFKVVAVLIMIESPFIDLYTWRALTSHQHPVPISEGALICSLGEGLKGAPRPVPGRQLCTRRQVPSNLTRFTVIKVGPLIRVAPSALPKLRLCALRTSINGCRLPWVFNSVGQLP